MILQGVKVNELARYLEHRYFHGYVQRRAIFCFDSRWLLTFFFRMRPTMDRNSAQWLSMKWVTAGRPVISRSEWGSLVEGVGIMTERDVMR